MTAACAASARTRRAVAGSQPPSQRSGAMVGAQRREDARAGEDHAVDGAEGGDHHQHADGVGAERTDGRFEHVGGGRARRVARASKPSAAR